MISLIYKGRALPLVFSVVKGNKGHLPEDTHVELVNKLRPLIPESTQQVIFLSDGEFDGTSLQKKNMDRLPLLPDGGMIRKSLCSW